MPNPRAPTRTLKTMTPHENTMPQSVPSICGLTKSGPTVMKMAVMASSKKPRRTGQWSMLSKCSRTVIFMHSQKLGSGSSKRSS